MTKRKRFSPETKASILKQHLQKKVAISDLCESNGCTPGSVYQWQEALFSNAHKIFESSSKKIGRPKDEALREKKMSEMEQKLHTKNHIISELMEELLREKKLNGVI